MTSTTPRRPLTRALAAFLAVALELGPIAESAYAAQTALADVPIAAKVTAKPNIVYTLDDSGSMQYNYLPDWVVSTVAPRYCRSGSSTTACTANNANYTGTFTYPPFYAADFNALAYNPDVGYTPPYTYYNTTSGAVTTGGPLTNTIGTVTDASGNQINFTKVQTDPFNSPASQANLSNKVAVPVYCNTDWPKLAADPTGGISLADVGDTNGEYKAGTGDWCRINGTRYDAGGTSGAPAANVDYNYPWQSSSGATGVQYFYRNISRKTIWCDKTSPNWPQVTSGCTTTCSVAWTSVAQTCNAGGPTTACCTAAGSPAGCAGPSTYSPSGCNGNPLYCGPYGTGSAPECLSCSCNSRPTGTSGTCSISGANCSCTGVGCVPANPNAACPNVNQCIGGTLTTTCSSYSPAGSATCGTFTWNPVTKASTTTTLLQDSEGPGNVCRHNNQNYAVGGAAGPFKYNSTATYLGEGSSGAGKFNYAIADSSCPAVGTTVSIPRHYYTIDSVQFCDNVDGTANAQWKGFGTGVCQAANDLTTYKNVQYGQFHRVDLVNDGRTYPYVDQLTGASMSRTYAQEVVNYANWYAYYRLRAHAAKTTSALAFNLLDDTYRVGFHILGTEPAPTGTGGAITWVDVADFALAQKQAWWKQLFTVPTVTTNKTPTLSAMLRVGNLFESGATGGLPASVSIAAPFAAAKDPFAKDASNNVISCQSNYHILFTDGFTNQVALPAFVGDQDKVVPSFAAIPDIPPDNVLPDLRPITGAAWPKPFVQQTAAVADTLSDVSTYYWARDLRPTLKNDVPSWSGKTPNDVDPAKDVAWWQHVNFSAISFGAAGTLDASNQAATLAAIQAGSVQWPNLSTPNNPPLPAANKGAVAVDDLWHATINARGSFVYARTPLEVQYGLAAILGGIANQRKSRTGAAFSGQVLSATNNIIYEPTIEQGWAGDLLKVQIDPTTAAEVATLWQAATVLGNQIKPAFLGDEPWMDPAKRRIVTWSGATKVAFRATPVGALPPLSAAQLATLSSDPVTQQKMVAYLRGGSTANPPLTTVVGKPIEGTGIGQFRKRYGPLGDITNAQPLVVSAPASPPVFYEGNDPGYAAFVGAHGGRPDRVVAPANDGMVHVFDSADGHEVFAYVPSTLLRSTVDASGKPTGLQALTFQDGGVPIYKHHFYVDSSPRYANVDFNSSGVKGGGSDWHTIVVGGLGKGGDSYYALDLTDGDATDETQAAGKLLWEVKDPDWKYTYGRPVIGKTYAFGWTVIVTSGYNNVSEEGRIYFLDPKTGAQLRAPMSVGKSCGAGNPAGLAQINGFTKDYHNQFIEQIYGGDLCGNFWRFNIDDPNPGNWTVSKLAILRDPGGAVQPVTTGPQIEIDFANGTDRYVFVGTGQLLDTIDMTVPSPAQQQTLWAIRDGSLSTPRSTGLPIDARASLVPVPAGGGPVGVAAPNGWYHDLPTGATPERIVIDIEADANVVTYIGTQVKSDPCIIALPADIYAREFATGKALLYDGSGNPWWYDASGGVGIQVVGLTDPVTGAITLGGLLSHEIPGTAPLKFLNPLFGGRNRFSWRLLTGE